MKRPPHNKRDARRDRFPEFERRINAAAFEAYLIGAGEQQFTSASDVVECFSYRALCDAGIEYTRATYSPNHLYVSDSRHGAAIFYVATPAFLREFQREVLRCMPSPNNSGRRYRSAELVRALRAALRLPGAA